MTDIAVSPRTVAKVEPSAAGAPPAALEAPPAAPAAPPPPSPVGATLQSTLVPQRGAPSSFTLPGLPPPTSASPPAAAPPAAAPPVPPYSETFGGKSYVKEGNDPAMGSLMQRAIAAHPELASGPLGQAVQQGNVGPEAVKALQTFLQSKGYSVGSKGVDGKFGPDTHGALADMLNGKPPVAPATPPAKGPTAVDPVNGAADDKYTAVFDMRSGKVTLPDGTVLEAHSGRGKYRDDPNAAHLKNTGPTPPGLYKLTPRESRFHGVEALRLTPINGTDAQGRTGLLAHSYMMAKPGDSHGCVVFKNYPAFLDAYKNGQIRQIRVV